MYTKLRKLTVAAAIVALSLSLFVGAAVAEDRKDEMANRIKTIFSVVEGWHKDGADLDKFTTGAIQGGIQALGDPYTTYFTDEEYTDFVNSLNASFSGIGAYLDQDGNYVVITAPIKGSPAERAGLKSGDRILEADGKSLVGSNTDKAVKYIRGPAGTTVTLKIERPSEKRTFTVTITREQINIPEVESKMHEGNIGYLKLSAFGDDVVRAFYDAVRDLKSQGAKGLVVDLRQNGGGYLSAAIDIASGFAPEGKPVVWEVSKGGKVEHKSSGRLIDLPTAVLVDGGTASASEIVAGAIQDYGAGPLVGVKTFGKGTVQQMLSLNIGGVVKVTVAEYLTPKERHVHGIGLTPDYVVENSKPDEERVSPLEFKRLILPNYAGLDVLYIQYRLQDLGYTPETTGYFGINTVDAATKFAEDNGLGTEPLITEKFIQVLNEKVAAQARESQLKDVQLDKAVELLKAKLR